MAANLTLAWPSVQAHRQQQAEDPADHMEAENQDGYSTLARNDPSQVTLTPMYTGENVASHPNMYVHLAQLLEYEIMAHIQTRELLDMKGGRLDELQSHIWQQGRDIEEWQTACRTVYAALDQHRAEEARLNEELAEVKAELAAVRQTTASIDPGLLSVKPEPQSPRLGPGFASWIQESPQVCRESSGADREVWRLGFIRDVEEHMKGKVE